MPRHLISDAHEWINVILFGLHHPLTLKLLGHRASCCVQLEKLKEAESLYVQIFASQEHIVKFYYFPAILEDFGKLCGTRGNVAESISSYKRALELKEKIFGQEHTELINTLEQLARISQEQKDYAQGESNLLRLRKIQQKSLGVNSPHLIPLLWSLANLYNDWKKEDQAVLMLEEALKNNRQNNPLLPQIESLLAQLQFKLKNFERAVTLYSKSIEHNRILLGNSHPTIGATLFSLGQVYQNLGDLDRAQDVFMESLEMFESDIGTKHPAYTDILISLGTLYSSQENFSQAEKFLIRAVENIGKNLGTSHPKLGIALLNLGNTLIKESKFLPAKIYLERAKKILEVQLEVQLENRGNLGSVLDSLATIHQSDGDLDTAEKLLAKGLKLKSECFGASDISVGEFHTRIGNLCFLRQRYSEAELHYRKSMEVHRLVFPPFSRQLATPLNNLASVCLWQGKVIEAEKLIEECIDIVHPFHVADRELAGLYQNAGGIYASLGKLDRAKEMWRNEIKMYHQMSGNWEQERIRALQNLREAFQVEGNLREAEKCQFEIEHL
eukprot:TRINITY_DN2626_c1_g1_i2.p1 TRINITY_DN2626_c1_g1~~TRINITY_DN2626_c1_g1_i2.p1  ORF type:complete len:556 (-),score=220.37 TRINITY_DN2626_c1_g1_i2:7-1674(-)